MRRALPPLLMLAFLVDLTGCGGLSSYVQRQSYRSHQDRRQQAHSPAPMMAQEAKASRGFFSFGGDDAGGSLANDADEVQPTSRRASKAPPSPPRQRGGSAGSRYKKSVKISQGGAQYDGKGAGQKRKAQRLPKEAAAPMVVYLGYLKLRVKRRLEAVDEITRMTEKAGGYIDSLGQRVIVLRIPASDFDKVMKQFSSIGEVVDRRVKALDVSQQFTDLDTRLGVARRSRERLLALLDKIADVQERLRIVNEIKRLSELVEDIESKLATLRNLASYFTITIELDAVVRSHRQMTHRSPFGWIRALVAHRMTIRDGRDDMAMKMPKGFVLFDKDDEFLARSADTSMLCAGRVDNEPRGDSAWWSMAVHHEMDGRDEELVAKGVGGKLTWRVVRNKDLRPRYWLIGLHAVGEDLYVVEVFFPNEDAWKAHKDAVIAALATFEVK